MHSNPPYLRTPENYAYVWVCQWGNLENRLMSDEVMKFGGAGHVQMLVGDVL